MRASGSTNAQLTAGCYISNLDDDFAFTGHGGIDE